MGTFFNGLLKALPLKEPHVMVNSVSIMDEILNTGEEPCASIGHTCGSVEGQWAELLEVIAPFGLS